MSTNNTTTGTGGNSGSSLRSNSERNSNNNDTSNSATRSSQSNRNQYQRDDNRRAHRNEFGFKGACEDMQGHVFQMHGEQRKRGQFADTLEQLQNYTSSHFKKDMKALNCLFTDLTKPTISAPKQPKKGEEIIGADGKPTGKFKMSYFEQKLYDVRITMYVKEEKSLEDTLQSLYNIAWGQCSELMQNRLEAIEDFEAIKQDADVTNLLRHIRSLSNELEVSTNLYDALDEAKKRYYTYYQGEEESNQKNVKTLKDIVATIEHYGGTVGEEKGLVDHEAKNNREENRMNQNIPLISRNQCKKIAKDKAIGLTLIKRGNKSRFASLISRMREDHSLRLKSYPKSLDMAYDMMNKHEALNRAQSGRGGRFGRGGGDPVGEEVGMEADDREEHSLDNSLHKQKVDQ